MGDNLDLLHGFLALICCLEYVMRTTPSFLLNPPYGEWQSAAHVVCLLHPW